MKPLLLARTNESTPWLFIKVLIAVMAILAFVITASYQTSILLVPYDLSPVKIFCVILTIACYPLASLFLWRNHRAVLLISTLVLILGDFAPGFTSPIYILLTLPNLIYLLYVNRNSWLRYYILPCVALSIIYFLSAFLLNFIDDAVTITRVFELRLGWLNAFGGFIMVYHLIFVPTILYHCAVKDKAFFKTYLIFVCLIVNFIALQGLVEYIQHGRALNASRISSIMRKATRLAPFLASALPIFIVGLMDSKTLKSRLFFSLSILLNVFVLLITYSRGPLVMLVILWGMLMIGFFTSQNRKLFKYSLIITVGVAVLFIALNYMFNLHFLSRFSNAQILAGIEDRAAINGDYFSAVKSYQTSNFRFLSNFLFGYGWFAERRLAHFDIHNSFIAGVSIFGLVGMVLYCIPYVSVLVASGLKIFNAPAFGIRPRYAMACAVMLMFFVSSLEHNKLYSPIETAFHFLIVGVVLGEEFANLFVPKSSCLIKDDVESNRLNA